MQNRHGSSRPQENKKRNAPSQSRCPNSCTMLGVGKAEGGRRGRGWCDECNTTRRLQTCLCCASEALCSFVRSSQGWQMHPRAVSIRDQGSSRLLPQPKRRDVSVVRTVHRSVSPSTGDPAGRDLGDGNKGPIPADPIDRDQQLVSARVIMLMLCAALSVLSARASPIFFFTGPRPPGTQ